MSYFRRARRRQTSGLVALEILEQRQLLSGTTVAQAEQSVRDAQAALTNAQEKLKTVRQEVGQDLAAKRRAFQEAKDAWKAADRAATQLENETQSLVDQANAAREAQAQARGRVSGPALFELGRGRGRRQQRKTMGQLIAEAQRMQGLLQLSRENSGPNPSARQLGYQFGKQARIHEINAELKRREAAEARTTADGLKEAMQEARRRLRKCQMMGPPMIAAAKQAVAQARTALATANSNLQQARDDAAVATLDREISDTEGRLGEMKDDRKTVCDSLDREFDMLRKELNAFPFVLYFAKKLGLTPRSFGNDDLAAWKAQMEELTELTDQADDEGLLPPAMAGSIKVGVELLPTIINFQRTTRLQQLTDELNGYGDVTDTGRGIVSGKFSTWMAKSKHGEYAVTDPDLALCVMRLLRRYINGDGPASRIQAAVDRIDVLQTEKQILDGRITATEQDLERLRTERSKMQATSPAGTNQTNSAAERDPVAIGRDAAFQMTAAGTPAWQLV